MYTDIVLKPFRGPYGALAVHEFIDAENWRNAQKLREQRYMRPIRDGETVRRVDDDPTPAPELESIAPLMPRQRGRTVPNAE